MYGTMKIHFYPKKKSTKVQGMALIYARITINGQRSEFSLGRTVEAYKWNSRSGNVRGTTKEVANMNRFLDLVKNRCFEIYDELLKEGSPATAETIVNTYLGKERKQRMVLEVFKQHNEEMEGLLDKGYTRGTLQRYNACYKHLSDYISHTYRKKDYPLKKIDHEFITGLEYYLKAVKDLGSNSATKYLVNFKKIIRIAYANEWISRDPFFHWKARWLAKERQYLTEAELDRLALLDIPQPRMDRVRDIFLFCCFTGLAYGDVYKLKKDDIVLGMDGRRWIKTQRKKTKTLSSIPLIPEAEKLLDKYADHPIVKGGKGLLPVPANQNYNVYLKELADLSKINKHLTTHVARHTFATTVTLSNGVPIESVSKMLGHTSIKTTQIYAKVLDAKLSEDMAALQERMKLRSYSQYSKE